MVAGAALGAIALFISFGSSFILWRVAGEAQSKITAQARQNEIVAAALMKDAENARLETARINERIAFRTISPEQSRAIVDALRGQSFEVSVFVAGGGPEAMAYGQQLHDTLSRSSGMTLKLGSMLGRPVFGLFVRPGKKRADTVAVLNALTDAKIPFEMGTSAPTGTIQLIVGGKPTGE